MNFWRGLPTVSPGNQRDDVRRLSVLRGLFRAVSMTRAPPVMARRRSPLFDPIRMTSRRPTVRRPSRVHSCYSRRPADLPLSGRSVRLDGHRSPLPLRRGSCRAAIFTERFREGLAPWARRTARLDCIVHHLGLALGGRPAASFAKRLMLPVSNDTLLRVVRRRASPPTEPQVSSASTIGPGGGTIDTPASSVTWKGAGLSRFLPDREPATAQAWFAAHPTIGTVARDRGGGYAKRQPKPCRMPCRSRIAGI